jgi:nitrate reductase beta subunit
MKVMAQMAMVMNLDKCIGCHTCSVTCKQAWTNRSGMEYVWFNNVETRPGLGYPRGYEDQDKWQGGWTRKANGRLTLRAGGRLNKLLNIFSNPKMPSMRDYYEPWTYDYETLLNAPSQKHFPVARPHSLLSGKPINVEWSANWDDDLGGSQEHAARDVMLKGIEDKVKLAFDDTFMFYLPRICEHCLNPSCAASCPSGAIYKREEDGIVLVDQDKCRGWRMCVTGCPYKKVYFNHKTGKAEKCTFCYPRIEVGIPTVCAETCVGRLRYIGLMLYDADKVLEAASVEDDHDLYESQRSVFLDPHDPEVQREAEKAGIPGDWIQAAQRSPVHALINTYKVALPLHPEYRTMPMVWYIPPLSPVVDVIKDTGHDAEDPDNLFAAIDTLRIPVEYLANLFTAGDTVPVDRVLRKLAAMRSYMRDINLGRDPNPDIPARVGMGEEEMYDMFRLLAIAKYEDRYVIPTAHGEEAHALEELATDCPVTGYDDELLDVSGPFGEGSGRGSMTPVAIENFKMLERRQTSDHMQDGEHLKGRVNLLNWDGKGMPPGMFPDEDKER